MTKAIGKVPHKRRYLALMILALAVAATAALTTGAVRFASAGGTTTDTCGYSGNTAPGPTVPRASQKFDEIGIIVGQTVTSGGTPAAPLTVNVFYTDEHTLTLGSGTVTPWSAFYLKPGSTTIRNADDAGSNPAKVGATTADPNGTPHSTAALNTGTPGTTDIGGRPVAPALFLSDRTTDPTSKSGDWQNNGTAQKPNFVAGSWKSNGGADTTPANALNLGPHADAYTRNISTAQGNAAFASELRWDVSQLDVDSSTSGTQRPLPGHTYRVQMIMHDGDHDADTGEACQDITIPKAPSTTTTHPHVKVTENINVNVDTSASAGASLEAGDTLDIKLYKDTSTTHDGCTTANQDGGAGALQQGGTVTHTVTASEVSTGQIVVNLVYPDDFPSTPAPPALVSGTYWWFVSYSGNDTTEPSNDACTEQFSLTLP